MGCSSSKIVEKKPSKQLSIPKCKSTIPIEGDKIESLGILDHNNILIAIDKQIFKLDLNTCILDSAKPIYAGHTGNINAIINLSSGLIASAGLDRAIHIWNPKTSEKVGQLDGHTQLIWKIAECDSNKMISVSEDRSAILWNLDNFSKIETIAIDEKTEYYTCCYLNNGKGICGGRKKILKVFNTSTNKIEKEISMQQIPWCILPLKNGKVIIGQSKGIISMIDIETQKEIKQYKSHESSVTYIINLDEERIISGSEDHNLVLSDINNPEKKIILPQGHTNPIVGLVKISNTKFVSCSKDCIKIWEN